MAAPLRHVLLVGGAALVAGVGGWLAYRAIGGNGADNARSGPAIASSVEQSAAGTPNEAPGTTTATVPNQGAPRATAIPELMPDFALASREGPPRRLSSFTQPTLVVNFWATWCAPCRREIPLLKTLRSKRAASGVEIVGIAVDFREDVLKYAVSAHIDYPLLIGEQDGLDAANAFGMDMVFPFTVFADAKRRVIAVKVGELHENEADFILDRIADVNNGRLAADNARKLIAEQLRLLAAQRSTPRTPPAPGAAPAS